LAARRGARRSGPARDVVIASRAFVAH